MKRLKVTLGVMAAVAFAASMQAEGHSGEVGADGCHADGEPYHCHFRISNSTWIDPDPPGTPVHKIRRADRKPGSHQAMPEVHSSNRLEGVAKVIDGDTIENRGQPDPPAWNRCPRRQATLPEGGRHDLGLRQGGGQSAPRDDRGRPGQLQDTRTGSVRTGARDVLRERRRFERLDGRARPCSGESSLFAAVRR